VTTPLRSRRELLGGALGLGAALFAAPALAQPRLIDPYRVYTNRVTGERVRLLEAGPDGLDFEWRAVAGGGVPFEHLHDDQDEIFHVIEGHLDVWIAGESRRVGPGETAIIPAGAPHLVENPGPDEVTALVRLTPGLDALPAMQVYWGLCDDGLIDDDGVPDLITLAVLIGHLDVETRPAGVNQSLKDLAGSLRLLRIRPRYRELYRRYTGTELPG